jgi:hypothetical protein
VRLAYLRNGNRSFRFSLFSPPSMGTHCPGEPHRYHNE